MLDARADPFSFANANGKFVAYFVFTFFPHPYITRSSDLFGTWKKETKQLKKSCGVDKKNVAAHEFVDWREKRMEKWEPSRKSCIGSLQKITSKYLEKTQQELGLLEDFGQS